MSRIQSDSFEEFCSSLEKLVTAESISFTLTLFSETYKISRSTKSSARRKGINISESSSLKSSVYRKNPSFASTLMKSLGVLIPKTKSLRRISFFHIYFNKNDLLALADALRSSTSLEDIRFKSLHLYDEGLKIILPGLIRKGVKSFTASDCSLSDKCAPSIVRLLNAHRSLQGEEDWIASLEFDGFAPDVSLKNLNLTNNNLSEHFLEEIESTFIDYDKIFIDITSAVSIPSGYLTKLNRYTLSKILANTENGKNYSKYTDTITIYGPKATMVKERMKKISELICELYSNIV